MNGAVVYKFLAVCFSEQIFYRKHSWLPLTNLTRVDASRVWPRERLYVIGHVIHPTWCVPITKAVAVWEKPPSMNTLCFPLYEGAENDKESDGTHPAIK